MAKGTQYHTLPEPTFRSHLDKSPPIICRMVFDEMCVLANGEIVCSCGDPAGLRVYGNVYHDRLSSVFNGPLYREIRRWQLQSRLGSWCPVIGNRCGGRRSRASTLDKETGRTVKILQLEPISFCNLYCPGCPVNHFKADPAYRKNRQDILPLEVMLDIVEQLPDLEKILYYNFGEPFLHKDSIPFLREIRKRRPEILIHTNTNGIPLDKKKIESLASEALVDQMLFSIDGSGQNSYKKYRKGGSFVKALRNMQDFTERTEKAGTRDKIEIIWQYILFEWNDSDKETSRAQAMAKEINVSIKWVITHTAGASRRFTAESKEFVTLVSEASKYNSLTCDLQMSELWQNKGAVFGKYNARIKAPFDKIFVPVNTRCIFPVQVKNLTQLSWKNDAYNTYRLGINLRTETGRALKELQGVMLPPSAANPGEEGIVFVEVPAPGEADRFQLFIDVVEENVCWFHERSSQPLILELETLDIENQELDWEKILNNICAVFLGYIPQDSLCEDWAKRLRLGEPMQNFLLDIFSDTGTPYSNWDDRCTKLWKQVQPFIFPLGLLV